MRSSFRKLKGKENGFTLVEVLCALAILGIIAVGLFGALGTSQKTTGVSDERATAHNLAEHQMEYVKGLPWNPDGIYSPDAISSEYSGYSVTIDPATFPHEGDLNIQKIVITVFHHSDEVLQLEGYKLRGNE